MKIAIKQTITIGILFLVSTTAICQSAAKSAMKASMFHNDMTLQAQMQKNFAAIYKANVIGTPYYDESFSTANISPLDKVFSIRYNAALDDMEIIQGKDTLIMNKKNKDYVIKQHKGYVTYKILEYPDSKEDKLGYYIQLTKDAKITLYRKDRKKFVEVKNSAYGGNLNSSYAKFKELKSEFFIELGGNGVAIKLSKKKKDIIALFKGKEDEAKKFMKEKKLKTSKEKDLIVLIEYMISL